MTTDTYEEYEAARRASAVLAHPFAYRRPSGQQTWIAVVQSARSGSSGVVTVVDGYGPLLPHVGSSSSVVDRRVLIRRAKSTTPKASAAGFREVVALSIVEQLSELLAALSLNKSQLAQILRVTRPTLYEWFQGKEPNPANTDRVYALLAILARAGVAGARPLNARFIRQPTDIGQSSLIELLSDNPLDKDRIVQAIEQVRSLADTASQRRTAREARLRALGYDDPSSEQRKEQLATNVALLDWPKR